MSTTGLVDTKQQPGPTKRRQYSEALKRQMVAETQAPGASVSIVARRHDVNSNQLFRWRRQLLPKAVVESGAMVPVEIAPDDGRPRRTDREGVIEITFGCGVRVRLSGEVSPETVNSQAAVCPAHTVVTGGGAVPDSANTDVNINSTVPNTFAGGRTGWRE